MIKIKVLDWEKFNPRKDIKSSSWFRLENNFFTNPKFFKLSHEQKLVWLFILCQASQKQSHEILICPDLTSALVRIDAEEVAYTILRLAELNQIEILEDSRDADVTHPYVRKKLATRSGYLRTDGRTDGTNETRRTDELSCSEQKSPPHPVQINDPKPKPKKAAAPTEGSEVWSAYSTAYQDRYKVEPVRNAKTNKNCSDLVNRLGKDVAVKVVRFYLTHGHSYYLQKTHAIGLCLQDAESLHTQMLRDSRVTSSQAQQSDKGSEQADIFDRVTKRLEQKYGSKET